MQYVLGPLEKSEIDLYEQQGKKLVKIEPEEEDA